MKSIVMHGAPPASRRWRTAAGRDAVTGASLAFVGGFVDAAAFVALAGLFTSHVTGNFVLISDEIVSGTAGTVAKLAALPVFVAAVCVARWMSLAFERRAVAPLRPLLVVEALVLLAFPVAGELSTGLRSHPPSMALVAGMAAVAAMGVQNAIGRLVIGHLPTTTVMTVNVSQMTIDLIDAWRFRKAKEGATARARLRRIVPAVVAFAAGAMAGVWSFASCAFVAMLAPMAVLLGLAGLLSVPMADDAG